MPFLCYNGESYKAPQQYLNKILYYTFVQYVLSVPSYSLYYYDFCWWAQDNGKIQTK
jgi:hypothetical protein